MKWEIINPSDYYTLESDSFKCAAVAIAVIGQGKYPLKPIEGTEPSLEVPLFIFGGVDEWFHREFSESFSESVNDCLHNKRESFIAALRSVNIDEEKRTSMNNIGAVAQGIADRLELEEPNAQEEEKKA